jgi:uncharacterized membrane protein YeaQ/YmgE (transglycosylase-associated protein family)
VWTGGCARSGDEELGIIGHIVLGIVGAAVGGFLASIINVNPIDGPFDLSSIVTAVVGSVIVVWVAGVLTGRRSGSMV